ncbi:MAG TPA: LytTR family DNA-binding domain-containing protein [Gemmatimonadales bacterium]|nr:LytTR family DNA-binding domain-containing protein [Gemmatimonadales bacterium]
MTALRAVIVEDERLARVQLRHLLTEAGVEIVGEAGNAREALDVITASGPDVLFLDVRLPGASGIQLLRSLRSPPAVVFTTAYDGYALAAFELEAVDYLLKPFGRRQLDRALRRVRALQDAGGATAAPTPRLVFRDRDRIITVRIDAIVRLEARGDYVAVHTAKGRYLVHAALRAMIAELGPGHFLRIHRSHAVNLRFVLSCERHNRKCFTVVLAGGARVIASASGSRLLRRRLARRPFQRLQEDAR